MNSIIIYLFLAAGIGISMYELWKIIELKRRRSASQSWPVTSGKVIDKHISRSDRAYKPEITFVYSVLGAEYQKKISLRAKGWKSDAEKALNAIGENIQVRYNPEKPAEQITCEEQFGWREIFFAAMPLILLVVALLAMFVSRLQSAP